VKGAGRTVFVIVGFLVVAALATLVSPWSSSDPDGLERVARDKGFSGAAKDHALKDSPVADYQVKGVDNARAATALSGLIGVCVTFAVGLGVFTLIRGRRGRSVDAREDMTARSP
jgi:hypothetical protein